MKICRFLSGLTETHRSHVNKQGVVRSIGTSFDSVFPLQKLLGQNNSRRTNCFSGLHYGFLFIYFLLVAASILIHTAVLKLSMILFRRFVYYEEDTNCHITLHISLYLINEESTNPTHHLIRRKGKRPMMLAFFPICF